jgi:isopentenyl-diphosphate delta-isomerase
MCWCIQNEIFVLMQEYCEKGHACDQTGETKCPDSRVAVGSNEQGEELILVDENDRLVGFEAKLRAHQNGGKLHRAFSVFVFDGAGRMLLQRRAQGKYHFGGLWTNACCSHPRKGEKLEDAVHRRLREEFGFDTELEEVFSFVYRSSDPKSGLTEHEFDHVFCGRYDGEPRPNPNEIDDWKWVSFAELMADLQSNPSHYTPWLRVAIQRVIEALPEADATASSVYYWDAQG